MTTLEALSKKAGTVKGYAGDVTPQEAWDILATVPNAVLVDVRTDPEWKFVGIPDISSSGKETVLVSWKMFPALTVNERFADMIIHQVPDRAAPLFFLCRSGGRSREAAMAMCSYGFPNCFNITGGFEGNLNSNNQRGTVSGWKAAGLPWGQA